MTDLTLIVRKIREGDEKAFKSLFELYSSSLYRFAYKYVKSDIISSEIVQNTFVAIWMGRMNLDETGNIRSYLFTIAYHQILREFRRQIANPLLKDYLEYSESLMEKEKNNLDYDTYVRIIEKAKKKLSPRQRVIFELNREMGIPVQEIAQRLDISEQVVRNQLSTAVKAIRAKLVKIINFHML